MQPIDFDIREAILDAEGNIVISASAGTGKTQTTIHRILRDVDKHTDYHTFAAITFTRKAAKEILNRLGINKRDGFIGTNDNFILTEIIQPFMYDVYGLEYKMKITPDYSTSNSFNEFEVGITTIKENGKLCKFGDSKMNFAFQLALHILRNSIAARRYLKAKYYRIYIDEYQDSDIDMHSLFMYICKTIGIPLFIVGDIKQSIYGWRGGYSDGFKNLLEDSDFKVFKLKHNFRSNVPIQNYSNIFMDDVRENYQSCTFSNEIIGFAYRNSNYAVNYIKEWLDSTYNCAFLVRTNANAQAWSDLLKSNDIDFAYLPSSPLDDSRIESEHIWVARVLALYLIQERFSEYDVMDEIPLPESLEFKEIKKFLKSINVNSDDYREFKRHCIMFYEYLGFENSEKIENEIDLLNSVIQNPMYYATYNPQKYNKVLTTIHSSKGLQYKQVIILASDYNLSVEEDRYLHYVAVSRPENRLLALINNGRHGRSSYIEVINRNIQKANLLGFNISRDNVIKGINSLEWSGGSCE